MYQLYQFSPSCVCVQKLGGRALTSVIPAHRASLTRLLRGAAHRLLQSKTASVQLELRDAQEPDQHCQRGRQTRGPRGTRLQKNRESDAECEREMRQKVTAGLRGATAAGNWVVSLGILEIELWHRERGNEIAKEKNRQT